VNCAASSKQYSGEKGRKLQGRVNIVLRELPEWSCNLGLSEWSGRERGVY